MQLAHFGEQIVMSGLKANRPAPSKSGRLYLATDEGIIYRDTGPATGWAQWSPGQATPVTMALGLTKGDSLSFKSLTESVTIAAAATSSSVIQIPAGAVVLAVPSYVVVAPPGTATMTVGVSGTVAKFNTGSTIVSTIGGTDPGTKAGPSYFASAVSILITPNTTPSDATGRVRVDIIYYDVTAPTS